MMSLRRPLIAANWKMHKTLEEARTLAREVRQGLTATLVTVTITVTTVITD